MAGLPCSRRFPAFAIVLAAALVLVSARPVAGQRAPVTECDRLAADPEDPARVAPGPDVIRIDAVAACRTAVAEYPDVPRFRHQLARSLLATGRYPRIEENVAEAVSLLEGLRDEGYRPARYLLAEAYERQARLLARRTGRLPNVNKMIDEYEALVELGEPRAAYLLAEVYRLPLGRGIVMNEQRTSRQRELYRLAAEGGYAPAQYRYATHYQHDDPLTTVEWVRKAAGQWYGPALQQLALWYEWGKGSPLPKDPEKAAMWMERFRYGEKGVAERRAEEQVAREWEQRGANFAEVPVTECDRWAAHPLDANRVTEGVPPARVGPRGFCERALELYPGTPRLRFQLARYSAMNPAGTGDMWAECPAGVNKPECTVLDKDMATLRELADDGYKAAGYALAVIHRKLGQTDAARREYERLAGLGDPVGTMGLAELLDEEGRSAEAVRLYRTAAERGLPIAQSALGWMYLNGRGVEPDDAEAARWFQRAAEQDEPMAQTHLGFLYREGRGLPIDTARAIEMFRRAVERPRWGPQVRIAAAQLGWAYVEGRGVPQDLEEGYRWLFHAGNNGDHRAGIHAAVMKARGQGTEQSEEWARVELAVIEKSGENPLEDRQLAAALRDELCADEPANAMGCSDAPFPWEQEVTSRGVDAGTLLVGVALLGLLLDGGSGDGAAPHTYAAQCDPFSSTDPCSPVYWEVARLAGAF